MKKNFIVVNSECATQLINQIERSILDKNLNLVVSVFDIKGQNKKKIVVSE